MGRTPSITAIQYMSSASQLWTERRNGRHTSLPRTSTKYGCPVISNGYVQLLTKSRQIWISASHNFPRVSGFQKTSSAIVSKGRASLAPNQESTASKALTTRETSRPIPLSPVKAGRRGAGKELLKQNDAREFCNICLTIQLLQFIPYAAMLQVF